MNWVIVSIALVGHPLAVELLLLIAGTMRQEQLQ